PAPEVFALFDDVMILNEGEVMYHGPREEVETHFESLGFVRPAGRDLADYLLDLGTNQQLQYQVALPGANKHPRTASDFAELFRRSHVHVRMLQALDAPLEPELIANVGAHMDHMPEFHQSFMDNTRVLMRRQMMVTLRNTAFLKGRALMVILMGLIYSSTFYQFDPTNAQVVMGTMFQAILFLSLGQASQIPTYIFARDIFYKHRAANFYRTLSYVLACSVSQLPLALGESLIFGSMVYWMCGFVATAQAYFVYLILLVLTNLAFAACFFFVAAIAPDLHIAKPMSMIAIMFFVIFAGFVVAKSQMPDYLIWIYWLNPIAWCMRAVAVNQYRSPSFDVCKYDGIDYCTKFGKRMGQYQLSLFDVPDQKSWIWFGMIFMIASYIFFMFLGTLVLEYKRYESPEHTSLKKKTVADEDEVYHMVSTPKSCGGGTSPGSSSSTGDVVIVDVGAGEKNFVPVTLAFKDLWYTVPLPSNPKETIDLL
ncbi:Atp-binding protein, partial [Globisporangium polare]